MRPSDDVCKLDEGEACARCVIKNVLQRDSTIKNVYLSELVKVNETLRLNQYEKPLFLLLFRVFVINQEQNLF